MHEGKLPQLPQIEREAVARSTKATNPELCLESIAVRILSKRVMEAVTVGLLDDVIELEAARRPGPSCTVESWLDATQPDVRDDFNLALDSDAASTTIHAVITKRYGFKHGVNPVQRHRRGECACGPR